MKIRKYEYGYFTISKEYEIPDIENSTERSKYIKEKCDLYHETIGALGKEFISVDFETVDDEVWEKI